MQNLSAMDDPATDAALGHILRLAVIEIGQQVIPPLHLSEDDLAAIAIRMKRHLGLIDMRKTPPVPVSEVSFDKMLLALTVAGHRAALESATLGRTAAGR